MVMCGGMKVTSRVITKFSCIDVNGSSQPLQVFALQTRLAWIRSHLVFRSHTNYCWICTFAPMLWVLSMRSGGLEVCWLLRNYSAKMLRR